MQNDKPLSLSSKDFYVLLGVVYLNPQEAGPRPWTYQSVGKALGLSASQVHGSLRRLLASGLLVGEDLKAKPNRKALADFIVHGARYSFPAAAGSVKRGVPTGRWSQAFQAEDLVDEGFTQPQVWPHPLGTVKGISVTPLCDAAIIASQEHPALGRALVTFDVLRLGNVREVRVAEHFFRESLAWPS